VAELIPCALVLFAACGGGGATGSFTSSTSVTTSVDVSPTQAPPEDVDVHLHETPSYVVDLDKLYVEITSDDEHADVLRKSAMSSLASTSYVVPVTDGGDIELHVEVASLEAASQRTKCRLKIFVLRLPQHDLLAIADGGADVSGHSPTEACLSATSAAIVRDKLPLVFQRQLDAKQ